MTPGDQWFSGPTLCSLQVGELFLEIQLRILRAWTGTWYRADAQETTPSMFHVFPRWRTQLCFYIWTAIAQLAPLPGRPSWPLWLLSFVEHSAFSST